MLTYVRNLAGIAVVAASMVLPAQAQDEEQEPTTWTINITHYNEPVEISAPATEEN